MAYRVIKTVKGIAYEYEQRSYRLGGRVVTESRYIGPASGSAGPPGGAGSGSGAGTPDADRRPGRQNPKPTGELAAAGAPPMAPDESGQGRPVPEFGEKAAESGLSLQITANLAALRISADGLRAEHREHAAALARAGIDPAGLPPIDVRHGPAVTHQKRAFRRAYSVTLPKKGGNRQRFRTEYRKALGRATLDAMERSRPDDFARLKLAFDASFRASQLALFRYVAASEDPGKWRKAFALWAFGYANRVDGTEPAAVGLIDYGERKDWRGEFAALFAEAKGKGYAAARDSTRRALASARRAETLALKRRTVWVFARRRAIRRAQARIAAHEESLRKLELMRSAGLF